MSLAELLWKLFVNRTDVYGLDVGKGWFTTRGKLTLAMVEKHLRGEYTLGVHAISDLGTSKWICVDIEQLSPMPMLGYVRRKYRGAFAYFFTGGRGHHLFAFFDPPIPSPLAYELGLEMKGGLKVESYPKQPYAAIGNFVRLPLGKHWKTGKFSKLIHPKSLELVKPVDLRIPLEQYPFPYISSTCPYRVRDQRGCVNCTYSDGTIGLCERHLCYRLRS